ncbi:MAG: NADH-quinone oxidoreductase subunit H [Bacteroidetes bacterium]|nr:NADH-quinone oxidoreductase subunit H [Bacteroidota bacterium]
MMQAAIAEVLIVVSPLLLVGLITKVKAFWGGRKGAPLLQPYYDFFKLLGKGEVISTTTSPVFRIAPSIGLAAVLFALMIMPLPVVGSVVHFEGDFVLFAYLLGFARFLMVAAALDTGSSFEGMGASREVTYSTIVETAFFIVVGSLALLTRHFSFETIFASVNLASGYSPLVKILLAVSLFIMLLAEGSRVPVDDPNTHLELTMIHEVMVLDYSGPDLAFIQYTASLKMTIISILMADLLVPSSLGIAAAFAAFAAVILLVFVSVGIVESLIARSRISHIPQFLFLMTTLSLTSFAVVAFFLFGVIR